MSDKIQLVVLPGDDLVHASDGGPMRKHLGRFAFGSLCNPKGVGISAIPRDRRPAVLGDITCAECLWRLTE